MWPPSWSSQVTNASQAPSGDHAGWNSPTSASVTRRAAPVARSFTQSRSKAVKAIRLPSGEVTGCRICRAVTLAVVSTR